MVEVIFKINGEIVHLDGSHTEKETHILKKAHDTLDESFGSLRCRNKNCSRFEKPVTILVSGPSFSDLSFEINPCCDPLMDALTEHMKQAAS